MSSHLIPGVWIPRRCQLGHPGRQGVPAVPPGVPRDAPVPLLPALLDVALAHPRAAVQD